VIRSSTEQGKSRAVQLLVLSALGAFLCVCVAGLVLYSSTRRLNESRNWLDHSQDVVLSLQDEIRRVDRIESSVRLYLLNREEDNLRAAQTISVALITGALHLHDAVSDNPSQRSHAQDLQKCSAELARRIDSLTAAAPFPEHQLLDCRQVLSLMQEEEREVLNQRKDQSKLNASQSLITNIGFAGLRLLVVAVLFAFLLRDALRRERYEAELSETNDKLASTIRAMERQAHVSSLLTGARDELQLCVSSTQAQHCAARYFGQLLSASTGAICMINNSRQSVELIASWNGTNNLIDGFVIDACCGLRSGRVRWRKPGQSEVHCGHFSGEPPEHYCCLPLVAQGETLGVVCVECSSPGVAAMVEAHSTPMHELVELTAMAVASLNLRSKLEHQSIRDSLTGLFNRHFMEIALERELRRASRQSKMVAVLMLDVDYFKKFNDTFGHEAGDSVLREVAETLRQSVRNEDIICRYGGEEFVAILPEISLEGALERAEFLRRMVSEIRTRFRGTGLREITISIGVAMYPQNSETTEQILRAADRALYEAKSRGRNCVVLADQTVPV
jgi:diguanylate cyclase (GGDEF)-like protein